MNKQVELDKVTTYCSDIRLSSRSPPWRAVALLRAVYTDLVECARNDMNSECFKIKTVSHQLYYQQP